MESVKVPLYKRKATRDSTTFPAEFSTGWHNGSAVAPEKHKGHEDRFGDPRAPLYFHLVARANVVEIGTGTGRMIGPGLFSCVFDNEESGNHDEDDEDVQAPEPEVNGPGWWRSYGLLDRGCLCRGNLTFASFLFQAIE